MNKERFWRLTLYLNGWNVCQEFWMRTKVVLTWEVQGKFMSKRHVAQTNAYLWIFVIVWSCQWRGCGYLAAHKKINIHVCADVHALPLLPFCWWLLCSFVLNNQDESVLLCSWLIKMQQKLTVSLFPAQFRRALQNLHDDDLHWALPSVLLQVMLRLPDALG